MYNSIRKDPNIRILESLDPLPALDAAGKECVDGTRDGVEDRIVVTHVAIWVAKD